MELKLEIKIKVRRKWKQTCKLKVKIGNLNETANLKMNGYDNKTETQNKKVSDN